jgi:hypothetical protein
VRRRDLLQSSAKQRGAMADKRNDDCPLLLPTPTGPRDWRINRAVLFKWRQLRRRGWIQFHEIAEWYVELNRGSMTEEAARASAYHKLLRDLLAGEFEEGGRSQVLFLHPDIPKARMTPAWLRTIIERQRRPEKIVREYYLSQCWILRRMFDRWLANHELPPSPPRFEAPERVKPPPWLSLFEPREQLEAASARTEAPKKASEAEIKRAIEAVYDAAKTEGNKPPNIKELADIVQPQLKALGRLVSKSQIQKIGAAYKTRRRPRGKTVRSEQPPD